jgi:transcriptional regulator with XRE-family HTH domain
MLDFACLQSRLRRAVLERIRSGQLSGQRLAQIVGVKQPHISNFLHGRRGLSLEAMDRVLRSLEISALDLVPVRALDRFVAAGSDSEYEAVPLVENDALLVPYPPARAIRNWIKLKRSLLGEMKTATVGRRDAWLRWVLMRVSDEDAAAMYPRIARGALLLVDRHYNSLEAHRAGEVNMCAVRVQERMMVRWVERVGAQLLLRPERSDVPMEIMTIDAKRRYASKIAGRAVLAAGKV